MENNSQSPPEQHEAHEISAQQAVAARMHGMADTYPQFAGQFETLQKTVEAASVSIRQVSTERFAGAANDVGEQSAEESISSVMVPRSASSIPGELAKAYGLKESDEEYTLLATGVWGAIDQYANNIRHRAHDAFDKVQPSQEDVQAHAEVASNVVADEFLDTYVNQKLDEIEQSMRQQSPKGLGTTALGRYMPQQSSKEIGRESLAMHAVQREIDDISFDPALYLENSEEFAQQLAAFAEQGAKAQAKLESIVNALQAQLSHESLLALMKLKFGEEYVRATQTEDTFEQEKPSTSTSAEKDDVVNLDAEIAAMRKQGVPVKTQYHTLMKKYNDPADTSEATKKLLQNINRKFGK